MEVLVTLLLLGLLGGLLMFFEQVVEFAIDILQLFWPGFIILFGIGLSIVGDPAIGNVVVVVGLVAAVAWSRYIRES